MLTILIASLPSRYWLLNRLLKSIDAKRPAGWTVQVYVSPPEKKGGPTTGEKRQALLGRVHTPYCCFVDDDDRLCDAYYTEIDKALQTGPDVVGFRLRHFTNGGLTGLTIHSTSVTEWFGEKKDDGLTRYYRTPNHLNPIRTEIARSVGYPKLTVGEDAYYANRLRELHPDLKEYFIDEYVYEYMSRDPDMPPAPVELYDEDGRLTPEGMHETIRCGGSVTVGGRLISTLGELDAAL